jgi:hypothetical protein
MRRRTMLAVAMAFVLSGVALAVTQRLVPRSGHVVRGASAPPPSSRPGRSPPAVPTEAEMALLSPLKPGEMLAGWHVVAIQGIQDGVLVVVVSQDDRSVRLIVALSSEDGPVPPASAGRFAVYYSAHHTPSDEALSLASALADVLRNNQNVPVPPRLAPFDPPPKPGISL